MALAGGAPRPKKGPRLTRADRVENAVLAHRLAIAILQNNTTEKDYVRLQDMFRTFCWGLSRTYSVKFKLRGMTIAELATRLIDEEFPRFLCMFRVNSGRAGGRTQLFSTFITERLKWEAHRIVTTYMDDCKEGKVTTPFKDFYAEEGGDGSKDDPDGTSMRIIRKF